MTDAAQPNIEQFLTPEAMLTPGAAGALTMMITNALALNFETHRALTGLAVSFLFGAMVFVAARSFWQKTLYYVLNSLIIFCVALGANAVGVTKVASFSVISSAFAQETKVEGGDSRVQVLKDALVQEQKLQELKRRGADGELIRKLEADQDNRLQTISKSGDTNSKTFFKPWIK
jgi:hypothetical protein